MTTLTLTTKSDALQVLIAAAKDVLYDPAIVRSLGDIEGPEEAKWLEMTVAHINVWLARGDTVCFYRNVDLGHRDVGFIKIVSYGSPEAQLEREQFSEPPTRLPDIGTEFNWRYRLFATYEGAPL